MGITAAAGTQWAKEAPVAGSTILAGVLLKFGGYGLYRVIFNNNKRPSNKKPAAKIPIYSGHVCTLISLIM